MKRAIVLLLALCSAASAQPISGGGLQRVVHGSSLRGNGTNTAWLDALPGSPFGTGFDGAVAFDGTTTILGMAPSSSVYTLTRDIEPSAMTVGVGVRIKTAGYRIFVLGTLTNNGTIDDNGVDSAGTGLISGRAAGFYPATTGGADSNTTANDASTPQPQPYLAAAAAAAGGNGGTSGGAATNGASGGACQGGGGGGAGWSAGDGNGNGAARGGAIPSQTITQGAATLGAFLRGAPDRTGTGYNYTAPAAGGRSSAGSTGGSGGGDAGIVFIGARTIAGGGSFQAKGGNGGNATASSSGHGGGGGGAGGPGGFVVLVYSTATGAWTTNVAGGTHGNGSAGVGGGNAGGNGGDGGACYVLKFNLSGDGT